MSKTQAKALFAILLALSVVSSANLITSKTNVEKINQRLYDIEGRIGLYGGQATFTNGTVCILTSEALDNPELAQQLVRACIKAYEEKNNKPSQ